jgi:hypothetical protein
MFVSALALAIAMPVLAQNPSPAATPTSAEADAFVAAAEKEAFDFGVFGAQVAWVNNTYITDDTDALNARVGAEGTEMGVRFAKGAARFNDVAGLSYDTKRKLDLLRNLVTKLDKLAIGGGMANTFLYAQGYEVGMSYCEKDLADTARDIIRLAGQNNCKLFLPIDIVVAEKLAPGAPARVRGLGEVDDDERILDAGPATVHRLGRALANSATLIWNGPLGVFEVPPFDKGTMGAAHLASVYARAGKIVAVAGGGDTVAALNQAGVVDDFTFVSTAGGAFLEWMEGKTLPGVAALEV